MVCFSVIDCSLKLETSTKLTVCEATEDVQTVLGHKIFIFKMCYMVILCICEIA